MPVALMFLQATNFTIGFIQQMKNHIWAVAAAHARGKVLGGSSSINGMIYQRGNPMDYEGWAEPEGMETWDFAHCLPYFKN